MANEINIQISASLVNGGLVDNVAAVKQISQATQEKFDRVFTVATSDGALTISLTTLGVAFLTNLDATNFVTYGPESAGAMIGLGKLKPGETHALRLKPGITLRMQADTASCRVGVKVWSD